MTDIVQILKEMQQEEDCPMLVHMAFSESVREIERLRVQVSTLESSPLSEEALDILRAENNRLLGLIEEQKGTINALNIALGGDGSTSTENCVDAYELDALEEGLISRCRKLMAHIDNLDSTFSEILPALELLVAGIEGSVSETYIPLVKARAAIAKATGE